MRSPKLLIVILSLLSALPAHAAMHNEIFSSSVRSVQCHIEGDPLSFPVIGLGSGTGLHIAFDLIGSDMPDLKYRILHCNADWEVSNLLPIEYITGFQEHPIRSLSANLTVQDYIHYRFALPNEQTGFRISVNYLVQVQDEATGALWMQRRIMVNEDAARLSATAKRATIVEYCDEFQEVDVAVSSEGLSVLDPFSDIKLAILQNGDWNIASTELKPRFANQNILDYDYEEGNLFPGGNEYRRFMMRNYGHSVPEVARIRLKPERNEIDLTPVGDRQFLMYSDSKDLNGRYYIFREDADDSNIDADYAQVKFALKHDRPVLDGHVCIYGQLTDWRCDTLHPLQYDYDNNVYTGELYLKQGYYDYKFAVLRPGEPSADLIYFEGTHYRTQNEYQVLVYFRDRFAGYDRLVAYRTVQYIDK